MLLKNIANIELAFVMILIIGVSLLVAKTQSPTTFAVKEYLGNDEKKHAFELSDHINKFFGVVVLDFPRGKCAAIAEELYNNIAYVPLDVTSGYATSGKERIATLNFGSERIENFGTVDLIKGISLIDNNQDADSFITLNVQSPIRVPRKDRLTFLSMDLYGTSEGILKIKQGRFSTPSIDCNFTATVCDCKEHTMRGVITD